MAAEYDFYRNGQSDDVIFVWAGGGWLESQYGRLRYKQDDYIVIPRGTIYRLVPDDIAKEDYLIIESTHPVRIPERYLLYLGTQAPRKNLPRLVRAYGRARRRGLEAPLVLAGSEGRVSRYLSEKLETLVNEEALGSVNRLHLRTPQRRI